MKEGGASVRVRTHVDTRGAFQGMVLLNQSWARFQRERRNERVAVWVRGAIAVVVVTLALFGACKLAGCL